MKLLSPKYDVVFHALFREENKETCNIEIQLNYFPNIINRMIYYSDKCYTRQLKKGEDYTSLKRVISILILDYNLEELKDFDTPVTKWIYSEEETKKPLTSIQTLVIIELPKVIKLYNKNPNDKRCQWLMFLDNPNSMEVQNIMKKNKDIEFAISNLEQVSGNEKLKRIAELKEKGRRDEQASLEYATEKGLKQGAKLGKKEQLEEIIFNMNKSGFTLEQIQKATKLELEEIKKILTTK